MNPIPPSPAPGDSMPDHDALEVRVTALLLGELPAAEADQLRARIESDPALRTLHDRLRIAIELTREATRPPQAKETQRPEAPRLDPARRDQLLAKLRTPAAPPQPGIIPLPSAAPTPTPSPTAGSAARRSSNRREWLAMAAMLVVLLATAAGVQLFRNRPAQSYGMVQGANRGTSWFFADAEIRPEDRGESMELRKRAWRDAAEAPPPQSAGRLAVAAPPAAEAPARNLLAIADGNGDDTIDRLESVREQSEKPETVGAKAHVEFGDFARKGAAAEDEVRLTAAAPRDAGVAVPVLGDTPMVGNRFVTTLPAQPAKPERPTIADGTVPTEAVESKFAANGPIDAKLRAEDFIVERKDEQPVDATRGYGTATSGGLAGSGGGGGFGGSAGGLGGFGGGAAAKPGSGPVSSTDATYRYQLGFRADPGQPPGGPAPDGLRQEKREMKAVAGLADVETAWDSQRPDNKTELSLGRESVQQRGAETQLAQDKSARAKLKMDLLDIPVDPSVELARKQDTETFAKRVQSKAEEQAEVPPASFKRVDDFSAVALSDGRKSHFSEQDAAKSANSEVLARTPVLRESLASAAKSELPQLAQRDLARNLEVLEGADSAPVLNGRLEAPIARRSQAEQPVDKSIKELSEPSSKAKVNADFDGDRPVAPPAPPPPVPQPEVQTATDPFSTFSLNVSDVSFQIAGASLDQGALPAPGSIRTEEFINAFDYHDPMPVGAAPVAFAWERSRDAFAHNRDLLRFSIKTAATGREATKPLNLVLLVDNSGSMERADRVRIRHECLRILAAQLHPQDRISVVTFARTARLAVDGIPGNQAGALADQIGSLTPEGGTHLEGALDLAYQTARRHFSPAGINRVVLLTDGAANLGDVSPDSLRRRVEDNRRQGVALDCFGIGWEGLNDDLLENLSRNGDGRYGFINTPEAATANFASQLAGALQVAASDVKVQVEFNPLRVTTHRQVGYARHQLTKEQFRDNTVDAAELAAAEAGNALYVVQSNPAGAGPIATVRVRFKIPGTADYRETSWEVPYEGSARALDQSSPAIRLAAVASNFAEWLAQSPYAAEVTPDRLLPLLNGIPQSQPGDPRPARLESMIRQARSLGGR